MKKVLITATVLSHIAQFHKPLAEVLHAAGFEVHVAGKDNLALKNGLKIDWADKIFDVPFARSPKSRDNIRAYKELKKIIDGEAYDFIHCNTPMGGIVTRLAARDARKRGSKVLYTAHGFHFHKRASKLAWMVYYPIEKAFARLSDAVITINHEDYDLATSKFASQVFYIHGVGVDARRYRVAENESERKKLLEELNIQNNRKVILSIGELLPNKNHKMIIEAMKIVAKSHPEALLILAGNGPLKEDLEKQIKDADLTENIRMIGYCTFLEKYQKVSDMLVAASYREGLPLNLVESMLAGNPVVATHNRGHDELISHSETGFLVEPDDFKTMAEYIVKFLDDDSLRKSAGNKARMFALDYSSDNVKTELKKVYGL